MKRGCFALIFLSAVASVCGNGILERLQFFQQDSEAGKDILPVQRSLDDFLEKKLEAFSNFGDPYEIEPLYYNGEQYDISLTDLRMVAENLSLTAKSELQRQILRIKLNVKNINIDGVSTLKSYRFQQQDKVRFSTQNVACYGTAGLYVNSDGVDSDWVLVDCIQKQFKPLLQMIPLARVMLKAQYSERRYLENSAEDGLQRSIERALNTLTANKLKEVLQQLDRTLQIQLDNLANTKIAKTETSDSNTFLDAAISVIKYVIKNQYNDTVKLPDLKEAIPCSVLSILHCETGLLAQNGQARQLSTLERFGNARITRKNVTVDFAGTLRFEKLDIFYEKYKASLLGIGPTGNLRILSEPVIFGIQLELNFDDRRIYLNSFKLKKLGRTEVNVGGLGHIVGMVLTRITTVFIGIFNALVSRIVEDRVAFYTNEALQKNTIDDIINGNITL